MSTTTSDRKGEQPAPKHRHRDENEHVETLDHLGLVRDLEETLTPVDLLFNPKQSSPKPKQERRHYL